MNCIWIQDGVGEDDWDTSCHNRFRLLDETPSDSRMKFCCYCGLPLEESIATDDDDDKVQP